MMTGRRTINQRVTWAVFGGVGLALLLTVLTVWVLQSRFFDHEAHLELRNYARMIDAGIESSLLFDDPDEAHRLLASLLQETELTEIHVFRSDGTNVFISNPAITPPWHLLQTTDEFHPDEQGMWHVGNIVDDQGERLATVALHSSLDTIRRERGLTAKVVSLLALAMLFVAGWLSRSLSRDLTAPLVTLADSVRKIEAAPNQQLRAPKPSDDEVGVLADGINRMLSSLEEQAAALKVNEERLVEAQSVAGIGNWIFNHADQSVEWYDEVYAIFETSREEFDQTMAGFVNFIHPDDRDELNRRFTKAVADHELYDIIHRICLADDRIKWVHERGRTIYDADQNPIRTVGTVQDVTERMVREQQVRELNASLEHRVEERTHELRLASDLLRASEERLKSLMTSSPAITYSTPVGGSFVVTYVSENIAGQLGYQPDYLIGAEHSWTDLIHPADRPEVLEHLNQLESQDSLIQEYRVRHSNGDYRWLRDEMKLVRNEDGHPAEIVGCWVDVTELRHAQEERERLINDLRSKNTELEQFTYTVSHDLKSPLITIKGFLGVLEGDLTEDVEQARDDIRRIANATDHMTELLNDLLELSRIGRVCNAPEKIELTPLAKKVAANLSGPLQQRGVTLEIAPELPIVHGDRLRVSEVLQNLIENAVKYMGEQPEPRVEIGSHNPNDDLPEIYVRDNGNGIDPARKNKIFGLFHKIDRKSDGTGVGLALVKRIVEFHGGEIRAESEGLGHGSSFIFSLPASTEDSGEEDGA